MKIGLLIRDELRQRLFSPQDLEALQDLGELLIYNGCENPSPETAAALLQDCAIAIGSWGSPHPGMPALIEACPNLKLWEHVAGSVKHMFGPHLAGHPLQIASVKDAIAADVAEMVHGIMLLGQRRYFNMRLSQAQQKADKQSVRTLFRSHVGVVGASAVGKQVIQRLHNSGAQVHLYDPYCTPAEARELQVTQHTDIVRMCQQLDIVTIHTPLLDATHHLLNKACFQALPDHALLINSSRGPCIDQHALQAELKRGRLTAFLDVTEPEPLPDNHPLLQLANCFITPHIAGPPSQRMGAQCVDDIRAYLNGAAPKALITEAMLEHIA